MTDLVLRQKYGMTVDGQDWLVICVDPKPVDPGGSVGQVVWIERKARVQEDPCWGADLYYEPRLKEPIHPERLRPICEVCEIPREVARAGLCLDCASAAEAAYEADVRVGVLR